MCGKCDKRIDLLGHFHCRDFRCDRGRYARCHHQANQNGAELSYHPNGDNLRNGRFCTKARTTGINLKRKGAARKEGSQSDNRQRQKTNLNKGLRECTPVKWGH